MLPSTAPRASYDNRGEAIEIPVTIKITEYELASALCTAIEGGINYWCRGARIGDQVIAKDAGEVGNEHLCRNVVLGGTLKLYAEVDEDRPAVHILTREKLIEGFKLWKQKHNCQGFIEYNTLTGVYEHDIDASDADLIVQYALFGSVIYG